MLLNCGVGEDSWESLGLLGEQTINPKGNQHWIFFGKTDAQVEAPILQQSDEKSWLTGKDLDAGKDWRQEEKGTTEDEMVGWHHWLNGHEFEQAPGDGEGQGSLVCCSPWRRKELNTTEWLKTSKITQLSECKVPNWKWGGLIPLAWSNASWVWESRGVNVKFLFPGKVYTSVTR